MDIQLIEKKKIKSHKICLQKNINKELLSLKKERGVLKEKKNKLKSGTYLLNYF